MIVKCVYVAAWVWRSFRLRPMSREKCFEMGASDYLSKPVDNDELIAVLRTWLKRSGENG